MKKKFLVFSLIFVCLFSVFALVGCKNNDNSTPPALTGTEAIFKDFTKVNDTTYSIKVANATETFNFSNSVSVAKDSKWQLTADIYGIVDIPSKIGTLDIGDNTYYCMVTDSNENVKMYTLQVRRREIYTISFNTNSNSNINSIFIEEDKLFNTSTIQSPQKDYYNFCSWCLDKNLQTSFSSAIITEDIALYAKYTPINYSITYISEGIIEHNNFYSNYNIESNSITLSDANRAGFVFDGWYLNSNYTQKITQIPTGSNGNKMLYAKWISIFNIESSNNEGEIILDGLTDYGQSLEIIAIPSKIDNKNVVAIRDVNNSVLKHLYIEDGIKGIDTLGQCIYNLESIIIPSTITYIYEQVSLNTEILFWKGTEELRESITIYGDCSNIYYYTESQPVEKGNYWHFDTNGNPVIWE
ncbi:MAG: InlB B-repeat-containing protein [Christensenellales bacterium]